MVNQSNRLFQLSSILLLLAGITLIIINIFFTPRMLAIEPYAEMAASSVYFWRLGLASLDAFMLIIASIGIFSFYQKAIPNTWKGVILLVALVGGNSMLLAHEWNQFLFIHELARSFPETLEQIDGLEGISLYDLSAIIGVSSFFFGWLIGVIILWTSKIIKSYVALLVILGLIASPLLAIIIPLTYAGIISSILLASGWFLLGRIIIKN